MSILRVSRGEAGAPVFLDDRRACHNHGCAHTPWAIAAKFRYSSLQLSQLLRLDTALFPQPPTSMPTQTPLDPASKPYRKLDLNYRRAKATDHSPDLDALAKQLSGAENSVA
ncbi:MAG: hypothetical protein ACO34J_15640 [Prochlorothrix sp.]